MTYFLAVHKFQSLSNLFQTPSVPSQVQSGTCDQVLPPSADHLRSLSTIFNHFPALSCHIPSFTASHFFPSFDHQIEASLGFSLYQVLSDPIQVPAVDFAHL